MARSYRHANRRRWKGRETTDIHAEEVSKFGKGHPNADGVASWEIGNFERIPHLLKENPNPTE